MKPEREQQIINLAYESFKNVYIELMQIGNMRYELDPISLVYPKEYVMGRAQQYILKGLKKFVSELDENCKEEYHAEILQ